LICNHSVKGSLWHSRCIGACLKPRMSSAIAAISPTAVRLIRSPLQRHTPKSNLSQSLSPFPPRLKLFQYAGYVMIFRSLSASVDDRKGPMEFHNALKSNFYVFHLSNHCILNSPSHPTYYNPFSFLSWHRQRPSNGASQAKTASRASNSTTKRRFPHLVKKTFSSTFTMPR